MKGIAQHCNVNQKYCELATISRVTMDITVRYFTVLSRVTGKRQEKIEIREDSTIKDLLALLVRIYGESLEKYVASGTSKKGLHLICLLNGQEVARLNGLKTTLHHGDTVTLMPPIAGG